MKKPEDTIEVFTDETVDDIIMKGGSGEWLLDAVRAKQCKWLVCTQNQHTPYHPSASATAPHGSGFLLGKISGLSRASGDDSGNRWLIEISEYAPLDDLPDLWDGGRNPRRYTTLKDLSIDPIGKEFQPITHSRMAPRPSESRSIDSPPTMLTIAEAKKALALTFGVTPDAVEIMIRG